MVKSRIDIDLEGRTHKEQLTKLLDALEHHPHHMHSMDVLRRIAKIMLEKECNGYDCD